MLLDADKPQIQVPLTKACCGEAEFHSFLMGGYFGV